MAQVSSMMQSFYKGVNPTDLTIFYRQFYRAIPFALDEGDVFVIPTAPYVVPGGMMLDISRASFFLANRVGLNYAKIPDDLAIRSFSFQLLRNENAAWNVANSANDVDGIPEYAGVDTAGVNILEMLGATEAHIIYNQGDRLSASYVVVRGNILMPAGTCYIFCQLAGVLFSIDTWKRVISQ